MAWSILDLINHPVGFADEIVVVVVAVVTNYLLLVTDGVLTVYFNPLQTTLLLER